MVVVVFLLGLLYVAAIAVLVGYGISAIVVLVVVGGFFAFQYFASDRLALFAMHGQLVEPAEAPELHGVIDRICALSDTPKPKVAIANSDVPNAFATGRSPSRAVVCATTGLLRRLDPEELEGVLAHELSHVAHRDVAVMTVAGFLGVLAGLITRFTLQASMFGGFGGGRDRRDDRDNSTAIIMLAYADAQALLRLNEPAEVTEFRDSCGYAWLTSMTTPDRLGDLVTALHGANSTFADAGFGPALLCSTVGFAGTVDGVPRRVALVYLYKRGAFYPFAPVGPQRRDTAFELQLRASVEGDLKIEPDLQRWFPVWDAPGL